LSVRYYFRGLLGRQRIHPPRYLPASFPHAEAARGAAEILSNFHIRCPVYFYDRGNYRAEGEKRRGFIAALTLIAPGDSGDPLN